MTQLLNVVKLNYILAFHGHVDHLPIDALDHPDGITIVTPVFNHSTGSDTIIDECLEEVLAILDVLRAELLFDVLQNLATCARMTGLTAI